MERLSDNAIEIVNELHTERLAYESEYVPIIDALNRLAEYEDMEEQGLLLRLPCKVGDRVYGIHGGKTILPMVAKWIETNECGWTIAAQYAPMAPKFYLFADFGKTVFTSREEAEKALEGNNESTV